MKAKKTNPKSIRFNRKDLEQGLGKSGLDSAQELIDILLREYVKDEPFENAMPIDNPKPISPIKTQLSSIIKSTGTKNYFEDPSNLDGISNPNMPF